MKSIQLIKIVLLTIISFSSHSIQAIELDENGIVSTQQINHIIITVHENGDIYFNDDKTELEELESLIAKKISFLTENGFEKPTVSIRISEDVSNSIIEDIKVEVRKTSVKYIDVQKIKEIRKTEIIEINDTIINKYKEIVKNWQNQAEQDRVFSKEDVLFVREVYKKLNFNQMMRAGRLPSFVPKVEELDSVN